VKQLCFATGRGEFNNASISVLFLFQMLFFVLFFFFEDVLEFFFFFLSGDALWSETRISDTRLRFRVAWPSSRIRALLSFFVLSATQLKNSALRDVDYISFMATFHILWGEALLFFFLF
jgi:hypothetical protein